MVETKVDKSSKERAAGSAYKRPNFPTAFKRQLVEQTFAPGASVALIARRNDVNANLLFKWRRQYRKGAYGPPSLAEQASPVSDVPMSPLLAVSVIADTPAPTMPIESPAPSHDPVCEIEFERACVRIHGDVPPAMLQLILRELCR
jgi:transposase